MIVSLFRSTFAAGCAAIFPLAVEVCIQCMASFSMVNCIVSSMVAARYGGKGCMSTGHAWNL